MKKSLLIAGISSLVVLAGCGPTATKTTTSITGTNVSSQVVSGNFVTGTVVTETVNTVTGTQTTTVVMTGNVSSASLSTGNSVSSAENVVVNNFSSLNMNESMAIINNTKFNEASCQKIKDFMACSIKAITGDNQLIAANQMALQLKEMVADANRGPKCDSQYNMLKSSPELGAFEAQVNCKLQ